jgi:hypothetical protein
MMDAMGIFRTDVGIENPASRRVVVALASVMVDTGSEYTWAPASVLEQLGIVVEREARSQTADGRAITRRIGYARLPITRRSSRRSWRTVAFLAHWAH